MIDHCINIVTTFRLFTEQPNKTCRFVTILKKVVIRVRKTENCLRTADFECVHGTHRSELLCVQCEKSSVHTQYASLSISLILFGFNCFRVTPIHQFEAYIVHSGLQDEPTCMRIEPV